MNTENTLQFAKGAFSFAAACGTSRIIKDVCEHYSPTVTITDKVIRFTAGIAITGLVNEKIQESSNKQFDKNVALAKQCAETIKNRSNDA